MARREWALLARDEQVVRRQRFLMIQENEQDARVNQINVFLNWAEELKRLMREKEKK